MMKFTVDVITEKCVVVSFENGAKVQCQSRKAAALLVSNTIMTAPEPAPKPVAQAGSIADVLANMYAPVKALPAPKPAPKKAASPIEPSDFVKKHQVTIKERDNGDMDRFPWMRQQTPEESRAADRKRFAEWVAANRTAHLFPDEPRSRRQAERILEDFATRGIEPDEAYPIIDWLSGNGTRTLSRCEASAVIDFLRTTRTSTLESIMLSAAQLAKKEDK